jgi:hypothetical protein
MVAVLVDVSVMAASYSGLAETGHVEGHYLTIKDASPSRALLQTGGTSGLNLVLNRDRNDRHPSEAYSLSRGWPSRAR